MIVRATVTPLYERVPCCLLYDRPGVSLRTWSGCAEDDGLWTLRTVSEEDDVTCCSCDYQYLVQGQATSLCLNQTRM